MSAQGVSTTDTRVAYVVLNMTAEEAGVGSGTANPAEFNREQFEEWLYRVKDASFVSGFVAVATGDPNLEPAFSAALKAPTAITANRAAYGNYLRRGYTTPVTSGGAVIPAHNAVYLGSSYDAGGGAMFRDIGDNERGAWAKGEDGVSLPLWDIDAGTNEVTTAFTFLQEEGSNCGDDGFSVATAFDLAPLAYLRDASASVRFTGNVVVLTQNEDDALSAPTNKYFPEIELFVEDAGGVDYGVFQASTNLSSLDGSGAALCNYVMRLESGDVECPVYLYNDELATYPFSYGEDFIHEAVEWFPYAKNNPAVPVWDDETGELVE